MSELETPDQVAAETPSEEVEALETDLQATEAQDGEEGEQQEPDDSEEIEYAGAKHRIPKALKDAFLMQSDYTRKTQEVAEQRKAIEREQQEFAKSRASHMEHLADLGRVKVFDETLEQYSKVDWQTLRAQDPERANAAFQDYMTLRDQRDRLAQKVTGEIQQKTIAEQQSFAKRYDDATAELVRDIKGWNTETAAKVRDFALGNGITQDELREVAVNPKLSKILHKAWLGEQLIAKQQKAASAAAAAQKPAVEATPLNTVGKKPSGAAKAGLHDNLSPEEWLRRRNAQVARA